MDEFRGLVGDLRVVVARAYTDVNHSIHDFAESELKPLTEELGDRGRRLTVAISTSEYYVEARATLRHVAENEIKPLQDILGDQSSVKEKAQVVSKRLGGLFSRARKGIFDVKPHAETNGKRNPKVDQAKIDFGMIGGALKQAKDLIFDSDSRERQFDRMGGDEPDDMSARAQIARAERSVNRYLKVAASSVVAAGAGILILPPLKLVSAGLILYAAVPVFRGAYIDVVHNKKMSIRVLDSISFIGLLAGGYFLLCGVTSTLFHSSTKMMLKTEDRSRQMLADMFGKQPRTVWVIVDGNELEIPFELLEVGDTLVVHAGQMIPIDGVISSGTAAVDQRVLTGESQPAEKGVGDQVFAATVLLAGRIEVKVEKAGSETAAAQIKDILANANDFRTSVQVRWKDAADQTVVPTLGLSALGYLLGGPAAALAVVNSNYVAVMKVASPLGMLNFLQRASNEGILIKDGRALEAAGKVDTVVFDKTGTLTEDQPHVGAIHVVEGVDELDLLLCAAAAESRQTHPIALAILEAASARGLSLPELEDAKYEIGYGIQATISGRTVRVGSARYMSMENIAMPEAFESRRKEMHSEGASVVFVAFGDSLAGAIELRPTVRPETRRVVSELKARGLKLYIISGDHASPTQALAKELGIDNFFAEVLPQDKSRLVEGLQKEGRKVCFIGDGINDAIALKTANVSVSLRGASSLATNTAQIILMDQGLGKLPELFEVAAENDTNLRTLMATTFGPGAVSLAGIFFFGTGIGTALAFFNLSMLAGLVNGIWPALRQQREIAMTNAQLEAEEDASSATVHTHAVV
jgi:Cu2+-exporting ATPase